MKGIQSILIAFSILAFACSLASAYDPSPLQDFCVATTDIKNGVFVNGKFCKDPNLAVAEDFFFSGLNKPGNTSNPVALWSMLMHYRDLTLSAYLWFESTMHLMALTLLTLTLEDLKSYLLSKAHFMLASSNPDNRLFTKILNPGDVFVFPVGMIHFQFNIGKTEAVAFAGLSSQNAGVITIANAVFGLNPQINPDVLAKAFQLDKNTVKYLRSRF